MTLVRWNPINSLDNVFDSFDNFFNYSWPFQIVNQSKVDLRPNVNLIENEDEFFLSIDLPGIKKKDLQLNLSEGSLVLFAERKGLVNQKDKMICQESNVGKIERVFDLPNNIDKDKIKANFKNGVLDLIIPKINIEDKVKKIAIN